MKKQNKTTITKNTKRKGKKKRKKKRGEEKKQERLFARNSAPRTCREIFLPLHHVGHE